jgi:hypothetical protein
MPPSGKQTVAKQATKNAVFAQWVNAMQLEAASTDDTEFDPSEILGAILSSETFEEAVERQNQTLLSGKTIVDRPHTIDDFSLRPSDEKYADADRGLGVYAIVSAIDLETGEDFVYGVGASNVLAILWQARQFGRLPGDFVLSSREVRRGELLSLKPVGRRTIRGAVE